jgi:surfeit locus 1 family protein
MLVIPVTTFGLGTWQVFRLQWKLGLIDELERKTTEDPITIPTELVDRFNNMHQITS